MPPTGYRALTHRASSSALAARPGREGPYIGAYCLSRTPKLWHQYLTMEIAGAPLWVDPLRAARPASQCQHPPNDNAPVVGAYLTGDRFVLDPTWHRRPPGNCLRIRHEVVCRIQPLMAKHLRSCHGLVEHRAADDLATRASGRYRLRGVDGNRRSRHCDCRNGFSRRIDIACKGRLHCPHPVRCDRTEGRCRRLS